MPSSLNLPAKQRLRVSLCLLVALAGVLSVTVSCSQTGTFTPSTSPSKLKIFVDEDGIYALSLGDLEKAGLDLEGADPGMIQLSNEGNEVPIAISGQGRDLTIVFLGLANSGLYSRRNVYWLSFEGDGEQRMVERTARSPINDTGQGSFADTVRREEDLLYAPNVPSGASHWYWESLPAPASSTFTVTVPHLAPGDATLRLALLGHTSDAIDPDHHLQIHLNDCPVEQVLWDGRREHLTEMSLPYSCLREGENPLALEAVGDTEARADIVLVDWFEIDYQRRFVATDDRLEFVGQGGAHVLTGFRDQDIWLFDVTDPLSVVLVTGTAVEGDGVNYTLSFLDEEPAGHRYMAVSERGFRKPVGIVSGTQATDLLSRENQADYVVITHEDFSQAIQPLVEWRSRQGLRVIVATVTEVYDQFSYGLTDPAAIRELLRYAHRYWTKPAPRYALLVGDASYDYRDNLQGNNKSLLPSQMVETALGGQTTSDNWFVSLEDDDILPDLAIGRLPVRTVEEASTLVNKIIAYEKNAPGGEWRQRILLAADGAEPIFAEQSDRLADQWIPPGYDAVKIYAGSTEDPQTRLVSQLRAGSLIVNYIGHGSIDLWSDEGLFSSEQIISLDNDGRQPMVIMMSCLVGFFAHPELDSMAEELLLAENRGAIAVFAPSSLTLPSDQEPLNRALFNTLLSAETPDVGTAIMEAKRSLDLETADQRDVIQTFTLLGDPALRLASID